jgi:hypothetical protein
MTGFIGDPELTHVVFTTEEISDLIHTLEIRVQDERRMYFAAQDDKTRRGCREAADRLQALLRRLRAEIGARTV